MWINVKNKLPETWRRSEYTQLESEPVLVFTKHKDCRIATYESWDDGETYDWYTDGERWTITDSVTHWQPLPEAPEE